MKNKNKMMSFERALEKSMRYCAYQERCELDLIGRFDTWNVKKSDYQKILQQLTKDDFLNEERYIESYVRGKFFIKKWGRLKIKNGLVQKRVNIDKVEKIMQKEINDESYLNVIKELINRKKILVKVNEDDKYKKRDKIYRFMLSRGFEYDLISKELKN